MKVRTIRFIFYKHSLLFFQRIHLMISLEEYNRMQKYSLDERFSRKLCRVL